MCTWENCVLICFRMKSSLYICETHLWNPSGPVYHLRPLFLWWCCAWNICHLQRVLFWSPTVSVLLSKCLFTLVINCFLNILFIYLWQTHTERGRDSQWEKQTPCREPDVGLNSGSPGSCPRLKAVLNRWATRAAPFLLFPHPVGSCTAFICVPKGPLFLISVVFIYFFIFFNFF